MKQIYPDLWQSNRLSSGFVDSYAYLLLHRDGNILFYNTDDADDLDHIEQLGGLKYQLITHRDEAGSSLATIKQRFGPTLMFSEYEADAIRKHAEADKYFEADDHKLGDIDVLHTPGHTNGSVCFLYKSRHGKTYLFTGDTVFLWEGRLATLVLPKAGGSAASLARSLLKIRDSNPDVVMSSGVGGEVGLVEPTPDEWTSAIDAEIKKLDDSAGHSGI